MHAHEPRFERHAGKDLVLLVDHSVHTDVIDRDGRLVANIQGNRYTAAQPGNLIEAARGRRSPR